MANSTPTKTSFTKDKQPVNRTPRGKSNKTIILAAIRAASVDGLATNAPKEKVEKAFFTHIAKSAFNLEDSNRGMCLKLLADKGWANLKPSNELVTFDFDPEADLHVQAGQVLGAVATGRLPSDIAGNFINSISSMLKIQELTDFEARLKAIEDANEQA